MGFRRLLLAVSTLLIISCGKQPEVAVVKPSKQRVEATVSGVTSGTVRSEQIAELAFGTVGRVKELNVKLGDSVKEGEVLASVENEDLSSRLSVAREELERTKRLFGEKAMSRSNLIKAQAEYDAAYTSLQKSIIKAPCDGIVAELNLEVGQLSQITAVIPKAPIRVVDVKPRYVRVEIDEVDLSRVKVGMRARVKILAVRRAPFNATVRKVVDYVSDLREQDRTSEIELDVENEGVLLPVGASADVEVLVDLREGVLAIGSKSILGRGNARYVYLYQDGKAKKQPVSIGIFNYALTEITSGLTPDDLVVVPSDGVELEEGAKLSLLQ